MEGILRSVTLFIDTKRDIIKSEDRTWLFLTKLKIVKEKDHGHV